MRFWDFFYREMLAILAAATPTSPSFVLAPGGRSQSKDKDIVLSVYVCVCIRVHTGIPDT